MTVALILAVALLGASFAAGYAVGKYEPPTILVGPEHGPTLPKPQPPPPPTVLSTIQIRPKAWHKGVEAAFDEAFKELGYE